MLKLRFSPKLAFLPLLALLVLGTAGCGNLNKVKDAQTIANMRTVREAVDAYAKAHNGSYPTSIDDDFKSYFPGGGADGKTPAKEGIENPYNCKREFPTMGSVSDPDAVRSGKEEPQIWSGQIQYSSLGSGSGYVILGGGVDGKPIKESETQVCVLSNK